MTIVGLGQVTFLRDHKGVLQVCGARLHLSNVRVTDACKYEPRCGACGVKGSGGCLILSKCIFENTREPGVIVSLEGQCTIEDCQFRQIGQQAVEVREMGQVEIRRSQFNQVYKGVTAYAGARSVVMEEVLIENSTNEGVMASGAFQTLETKKLE